MARKKGKGEKLPAFTPMLHHIMDCAAFAALSPVSQCLYLRLKRRAGVGGGRNGEVFYAVREAAEDLRVNKDTVAKAFHQLQAHGFVVAVRIGALGMTGEGKASVWRLTEYPSEVGRAPTKDFLRWTPGQDFPVQKGRSNKPEKQKPVRNFRTACPNSSDVVGGSPREIGASCPEISDVSGHPGAEPVRRIGTPKDIPPRVGKSLSLGKAVGHD